MCELQVFNQSLCHGRGAAFPGGARGGKGVPSPGISAFGAQPPRCTRTLPCSHPQPKMMEISISNPMLRSKQSQLFITTASGQRWRRWLLIAGSSLETAGIALPVPKVVCSRGYPGAGPRCPQPPKRASAELRAPQRGASPASFSSGGKACAETQAAQNRSHAWRCCSSYSYRN